MSSAPSNTPSKPSSRKPVSTFIAKPTEPDIKAHKEFIAKLEAKMDSIFERQTFSEGSSEKVQKTIDDSHFQDVKTRTRTTKTKPKITDYSKDLSDHEEPAEDSQ
jgi:hypothetical protein